MGCLCLCVVFSFICWSLVKVASFRDAVMLIIKLQHFNPSRPNSDALRPQARSKGVAGRSAYSMQQLYHMLSMHHGLHLSIPGEVPVPGAWIVSHVSFKRNNPRQCRPRPGPKQTPTVSPVQHFCLRSMQLRSASRFKYTLVTAMQLATGRLEIKEEAR